MKTSIIFQTTTAFLRNSMTTLDKFLLKELDLVIALNFEQKFF